MRAGGASGTRSRSRQRTIYCSPEERAALGRRADAAGLSFSRFMVVRALDGEDGDGGADGPRLVLAEEDQRMLRARVELLDRCNRALVERLPGMDMSALGALAFLVRVARSGSGDGGQERR